MNPQTGSTAAIVQCCHTNARNLVRTAQLIVDHGGLLSAAYHLALLALEEVGKASLLKVAAVRSLVEEESTRSEGKLDDHYQKLFWAFFLPAFSANRISRGDLEDARRLAQRMHHKRLASLYVSPDEQDFLLDIQQSEVENTIRLAQARLSIEEAISAEPPSQRTLAELKWFIETSADERRKQFIFSKLSIDHLNSTGEGRTKTSGANLSANAVTGCPT